MKKRITSIIITVLLIASTALLSGCTKNCEMPGCRKDAQFLKSFCSSCQSLVDKADGIIDGVKGLFD